MKIEDIKPIGNFKSVLELFREKADAIITRCNKEKVYNSTLSILIKSICGEFAIIKLLSDSIINHKVGSISIEEMRIDLLYTHLIVIDLNNVAQFYLNNIKMESRTKQLQEIIYFNKDIFGNLKIE